MKLRREPKKFVEKSSTHLPLSYRLNARLLGFSRPTGSGLLDFKRHPATAHLPSTCPLANSCRDLRPVAKQQAVTSSRQCSGQDSCDMRLPQRHLWTAVTVKACGSLSLGFSCWRGAVAARLGDIWQSIRFSDWLREVGSGAAPVKSFMRS